jgi:small subunit ribosomal protein S17
MAEERGHQKERVGLVVSNKMDKTITVAVERRMQHPLYKKVIRRTRKFHAHDEKNVCNEGDLVRIRESRPLSKSKRWRLVEVVKQVD